MLSEHLAEYVNGLSYDQLPEKVVEQAKRATLDQLGCQLIASTLEWNQTYYRFIRDLKGTPQSTIVNFGTKALAFDAAYVNGSFGQGAELDDYMESGGHPGAICVPIALALSEKVPVTGKDFLTAIAAGYQVSWGLGKLMYSGILSKGFHSQTVIGVFVAAAVAGKLMGLKTGELVHAFGIAGSHAGGTMEYDHTGGEVKRIHTGIAVRGGMQSAMLAQYGLTGPTAIFEGGRGIGPLFAGQAKLGELVLDKDWGIMRQAIKSYPCVGGIQSPINILSRLIARHSISPEQVEKIEVYLSEPILKHAATITEPHDVLGAQFSLAYSLAVRLLKGNNDLPVYLDSKLWRDPDVLSLIHKVQAIPDPQARDERKFATRMKVLLKDGRTLEDSEENTRGTPANPLSQEELVAKFRRLAVPAITTAQADQVVSSVAKMESLKDVSRMVPLLVHGS